ncbi:outer membrane protein assembly factor BamE [Sphingomonas sp. LB-2]|uniref:outer membrane protein assembly factor BamE n=1 Tax=Sphingomonas caeni TaxID=2984949 RepID=UPI002231D7F6|nr:outer membrane protein assembly factor BamE [Sphingomonas caeni]MCW3846539.1 outer membrane protein assembly factor BamE [Sphingomonas caeni]
MPVFSVRAPVRALASAAVLIALAATAACTPVRTHQGYVVDGELVASIQPGVDNRDSVLKTLGRPTFVSQFDGKEWYYVARDSSNMAYNSPNAKSQVTLRVTFDGAGNVAEVKQTGIELVASVNPSNKTTPTLGRKRSFFDDLFGNIGQVGAGGAPAGGEGQ